MDPSPDSIRYLLKALDSKKEWCQDAPSGRIDLYDELRSNFQSSQT